MVVDLFWHLMCFLLFNNFVSMGLALSHIQFKLATFPKLPLPMALRIWKWSKFTEKKKVTDIIVGAFDYIIKIKMAIFVHYGEIKYSTIMVWYFSSTNTANTNQSGYYVSKVELCSACIDKLSHFNNQVWNTSCRNVTLSQFVCFICFCFLFFCFFFFR